MKPFTFKSVKKTPWRVELPDGRKVTLQPCAWGDMMKMDEAMHSGQPAEISKMVARLLSINLEGTQITVKEVNEQFDAQAIKEFMNLYAEYLGMETDQKN